MNPIFLGFLAAMNFIMAFAERHTALPVRFVFCALGVVFAFHAVLAWQGASK